MTPTPNEAIVRLVADQLFKYHMDMLEKPRTDLTPYIEPITTAITNLLLEARIDEIDTALNLNLTGKIWVGVKEKDNLRTFLEERRKDLKKEIK